MKSPWICPEDHRKTEIQNLINAFWKILEDVGWHRALVSDVMALIDDEKISPLVKCSRKLKLMRGFVSYSVTLKQYKLMINL